MKKLYIVTGALGHLGSTIIRYLLDVDCEIRGLILPCDDATNSYQTTYYKGDVTILKTLEPLFANISAYEVTVIHTAAIISIGEKITPHLYDVNVNGTKNIIDMCIKHRVRRLVHVSSVHAIPELEDGACISEVDSFCAEAVHGAYSKTKAEASQAVMDAVKAGLDAVIVHPSGIIGPFDGGDNHLVQLISMYITGKLPAGISGGYDFVDVRDVAKGCLLAADSGKTGRCYILSNCYCSVKELLEMARRVTGGKKIVCFPIYLAKVGLPFFELFAKVRKTRPLYTRYALYTLSSNGNFSHERASQELGYSPRDLESTVRDTVLWLEGAEVRLDKVDEPNAGND